MGIGEQYELEMTGNIRSEPHRTFVSKCCGKSMTVAGSGTGEGSSHWYECVECGKPCDVVIAESKP